MNETRRQRMLREALGPDPVAAYRITAEVAFVFTLLIATGFASSLGTHDVPVVNGAPASETRMLAEAAGLAALISDANRDE